MNSIVLGKCIVQKQRHNLVAAQTFTWRVHEKFQRRYRGRLNLYLFSSAAFPGGKDSKKVAGAWREEHGREQRKGRADRWESRGKVHQSGLCNGFGAEAVLEDLDCNCNPGGENQPSKRSSSSRNRRVRFQRKTFSPAPRDSSAQLL